MQTIQIPSTQYIYPPRAELAIPPEQADIFLNMGWSLQLKFNDSRALIKITPTEIELWNRHGEQFRTYTPPEWLIEQINHAANILNLDRTTWHLLDGGLLDQKHPLIKNTIVLWDILVRDGYHQLGTTYQERWNSLRSRSQETWSYDVPQVGQIDFGCKLTDNIFIAETYKSTEYTKLWELVHKVNKPFITKSKTSPVLEGIFFKDTNGTLQMGYSEHNNDNWQARSRITTGRHRY